MKIIFNLLLASVLGLILAGCTGDTGRIEGRFVGNGGVMVYLEKVLPASQITVDTVRTDQSGSFSFKVKLDEGQPTIFNVRCGNELIPLLISSGERVRIHSVGSIARNYTVEGSPESERMRELSHILTRGTATLDSILSVYGGAEESQRQSIITRYMQEYYRVKREHIAFIASRPSSLASLYALYQRLPGDEYLADGENDIIYYKQVADSTTAYHPNSIYVRALQKAVKDAEAGLNLQAMIDRKLAEDGSSYPDLDLPDMYGRRHKLSEFDGSIIILDFWSASDPQSKLLNAELKEIYEKYSGRGLQVYQVSADIDKLIWVTAVQEQKLPWVSVCDLRGQGSIAVKAYNVSAVPANFIIDAKGNIIAKNVYGDNLKSTIRELVR